MTQLKDDTVIINFYDDITLPDSLIFSKQGVLFYNSNNNNKIELNLTFNYHKIAPKLLNQNYSM